jgi:hypothetical protein
MKVAKAGTTMWANGRSGSIGLGRILSTVR